MNRGSCTRQRTGPYRLPLLSPSRLNKVEACERRYGFNYLLGRYEESGISATAGQGGHAEAEAYTRYGTLPSLEEAVRAIAYAPAPGVAESEVNIRYDVDGKCFTGYVDLAYDWEGPDPISKKAIALGKAVPVGSSGTTVIHDWKFTNSLGNAKSANTLKLDKAANMYAYDAFLGGAKRVFCRWVYIEFRKRLDHDSGKWMPRLEDGKPCEPKQRDLWFEIDRNTCFEFVKDIAANAGSRVYEIQRTRPDIQSLDYNKSECWAYKMKCPFYDECKPPQGIRIGPMVDFKTQVDNITSNRPPLPGKRPPLPGKKLDADEQLVKEHLEATGSPAAAFVGQEVGVPEAGFINPVGGPSVAADSPEMALDLQSKTREELKALAFKMGLTAKLETKVRDPGLVKLISDAVAKGAKTLETPKVELVTDTQVVKAVMESVFETSPKEVTRTVQIEMPELFPEDKEVPLFTLYIDCEPKSRRIFQYTKLIEDANLRLQERKGVRDYRQISFTGTAELCLAIRDFAEEGYFNAIDEVCVNTNTPEGQAILSTLMSLTEDQVG